MLPRILPRCAVAVAAVGALVSGCGTGDPNASQNLSTPSTVVPAFLDGARTSASWNPNVTCRATVTTLRRVLGTQRGPSGGATFQGGGLKPGIPDRRALHPPCMVNGVPTLVQLNNVQVGACSKINADGDWTCSLTDPRLDGAQDMRRIHIETDQKFRQRRGWTVPPARTAINIQGFVFWDPGHTGAAWHNHSGWEIHSFTAWRRAG